MELLQVATRAEPGAVAAQQNRGDGGVVVKVREMAVQLQDGRVVERVPTVRPVEHDLGHAAAAFDAEGRSDAHLFAPAMVISGSVQYSHPAMGHKLQLT